MFPPGEGTAALARPRGKRIVLTTMGSLGDVHPFIAIALGLQARGHEAVLATCQRYRKKIEEMGLGFHAVRPDFDFLDDPIGCGGSWTSAGARSDILRKRVLPALKETYEDTLAAVEGGADLLVSHPLTFATRLVSETRGIAWASTHVTPLVFGSAHDPARDSHHPRPLGAPPLPRPRLLGTPAPIADVGDPLVGQALGPPALRDRPAARRGQPAGRGRFPFAGPGPVLEAAGRPAARLASADDPDRLPVL